jgi:hypothetical protein
MCLRDNHICLFNSLKMKTFILTFSLIILSTPSFAWHDYGGHWGYGYWVDYDWHGSGRDYPYSYYINEYGSPGYRGYATLSGVDEVTTPVIVPVPASVRQVKPLPAAADDQPNEITVNIPNDHGGYTPVVIKRSGKGFAGPQGEFYPEFPKVSQLKVMYGR